jgi:hypothetical protein
MNDRKIGLHPIPYNFDPEGGEYDMKAAKKAGEKPDETGHWPSRNPRTGRIYKGRRHPTWHKTVEGEKKQGLEIYKDKKDGYYYSRPVKRK